MKSYEVTLKIRNNYLLELMRENGIKNAAELAKRSNVHQSEVSKILNLACSAVTPQGQIRKSVAKLADHFGVLPDEIFPPQHFYESIPKNTFVTEMDAEEMLAPYLGRQEVLALEEAVFKDEQRESLERALGKLSPKARTILVMTFGLLGESPKTREEIGEMLEMSPREVSLFKSRLLERLKNGYYRYNRFLQEIQLDE